MQPLTSVTVRKVMELKGGEDMMGNARTGIELGGVGGGGKSGE